MKNTAMARAFVDTIGFTRVASLSQDDIQELDLHVMAGAQNVMIMPDVHSLHIFVEEPDNTYWHQILDYPYDEDDCDHWFDEWADSYEGDVEGESLEDVATDGGFYRIADKPEITIAEIMAKYSEVKSNRQIFDILEPA
jgi:hypothetical protein